MKLLVHVCCGPCLIYPYEVLKSKIDITPYFLFFNPNIHPFLEFENRVNALLKLKEYYDFNIIWHPHLYDIKAWLSMIDLENRCASCYYVRLEETAKYAKKNHFEAFSTTLLFSKYQKHEKIIEIARGLEREFKIEFYYEDFRIGWEYGRKKAREMNIYMQSYCGCIFSEEERYKKRINRLRSSLLPQTSVQYNEVENP